MKYPFLPRAAALAKLLWAQFLCLMLLSACATRPVAAPPPAALFADERFAPSTVQLDEADIFALTPAMRAYVTEVLRRPRGQELRRALFEALYKRDQLQLEYDSTMTRTAAQAFEARQGNCLSLVIMTAALARELNIPVVFQSVPTGDTWSRTGSNGAELYFNSGHVNLKLGRTFREGMASYDIEDYTLIDFMPLPPGKTSPGVPIERQTVVAMFMNNRAAEALARDAIDDAYWWARRAALADPALPYSYNTLAVVYRRHGDDDMAERALRLALERQPKDTVALSNLAHLLEADGRHAEARVLRMRLAALQPVMPFYYFDLGRVAMQQGDYRRARTLFERELQRDPDYHEFHAWLAAADALLGDLASADRHMQLAIAGSTTRADQALYAAKLDRLRAQGAGTVRR